MVLVSVDLGYKITAKLSVKLEGLFFFSLKPDLNHVSSFTNGVI